MNLRSIVVLLALLAAAACSEPLEFADWTIAVPEGTRIIEYPYVPFEDRTEWVALELDLIIGSDEDDFDGSLYRPLAVAADDERRVYVADAGHHQVLVYGADGTHVRSLGRQGQGPGEFMGPIEVTVAGTTLVVADTAKLSLWTLTGEHLGDTAIGGLGPQVLFGATDGSMVVSYPAIDELVQRATSKFARWDQRAQELAVYPTLPVPEPLFYPSGSSEQRISIGTGQSWPSVAASLEGDVYLTQSDEYQVLAFDAEGSPRWAMRVAMPRPSLFRRDIERTLENVRKRFPDALDSSIDWPAASYALSSLLLDGHGHLYVLPYIPPEFEAQEREVDVYSREGERLFAGRIVLPVGGWSGMYAASGDFMFFMSPDAETGEWEVARYRLVEPFD